MPELDPEQREPDVKLTINLAALLGRDDARAVCSLSDVWPSTTGAKESKSGCPRYFGQPRRRALGVGSCPQARDKSSDGTANP